MTSVVLLVCFALEVTGRPLSKLLSDALKTVGCFQRAPIRRSSGKKESISHSSLSYGEIVPHGIKHEFLSHTPYLAIPPTYVRHPNETRNANSPTLTPHSFHQSVRHLLLLLEIELSQPSFIRTAKRSPRLPTINSISHDPLCSLDTSPWTSNSARINITLRLARSS